MTIAKLSKKEISTLLTEVAAELESSLAKTTPGQEASSEEDADVSATAPSPASEGADASAAPGAAGDEASSPSPAAPSADAGGSPDMGGGDPAADPAAGGDEGGPVSVEALQAEYAKLPPDALKMHLIACKEALMAVMGGGMDAGAGPDAGGGPDMGAPPAAPPAPMASPSPAPTPAFKSEKANKEIEDLRKKVSDTEEQFTKLVTALETFVGRPQSKAITALNAHEYAQPAAGKPVTMTKAEIHQKLTELSKSEKTSSADREVINGYYFGTAGVADIEHLLKK